MWTLFHKEEWKKQTKNDKENKDQEEESIQCQKRRWLSQANNGESFKESGQQYKLQQI